jgi:hypothetical protein
VDIAQLLGQDKQSKAVVELLNQFSNPDTLEVPYHLYWSIPKSGFTLLFNTQTNKIVTVFLYSNIYDSNYSEYTGVLPRNFSFSDNCKDIQRRFGSPTESGKRYDQKKEKLYSWELYKEEEYSIVFEFDDEGRLALVTLSSPNSDRNP